MKFNFDRTKINYNITEELCDIEYSKYNEYQTENAFISRVEFTTDMIASWLNFGYVIGIVDGQYDFDKHQNGSFRHILVRKMSKEKLWNKLKIENQVEFPIISTHSNANTWLSNIVKEYHNISGIDELVFFPFIDSSSTLVVDENTAMSCLYERRVDLLILGKYVYFPIPATEVVNDLKGDYQVEYIPITEMKSENNVEAFENVFEIESRAGVPCGTGSVDGQILSLEDKTNITLQELIRDICNRHNIKSVNNIACGLYGNWEHNVKYEDMGIDYHGYEIVNAMVEQNKKDFPDVKFSQFDLTQEISEPADLIICRQTFQHLTNTQIKKGLTNFVRSGAKYLLLSNWKNKADYNWNVEACPMDFYRKFSIFRPLDLEQYPFSIPEPVESYLQYENFVDHFIEDQSFNNSWYSYTHSFLFQEWFLEGHEESSEIYRRNLKEMEVNRDLCFEMPSEYLSLYKVK